MFLATRHELLPYLRRNWRPLTLLLVGILLPMLVVLDLTEDVFRHGGFTWDEAMLQWYRERRTPQLNALAHGVAWLGGIPVLPLVSLALAGLLAKQRAKVHGWFLLLSVLGATLLNILVKVVFQRPRPDLLGAVLAEPGYSFPSGHAMSNAAFGLALAYIFWRSRARWPVAVAGIAWAVIVAVSRNYLGVHYPTDVLVGFLASLSWVSGLRLSMRRWWPKLEQSPAGPHDTRLPGEQMTR